ncbi:P68 family surface lipoprotein [[Mycoplasma] collis]|uniref:P68 family surface lipoprotein n=1 Tax=[Mycoplasma] collis TaxID=2127 RepID=UPI00051C4A40|nr:hypothetical protein [[Mycoplasma] collis]
MKIFKKKNIFKTLFMLSTITAVGTVVSCGTQNVEPKVKLATAQGDIWPLMRSLAPVIKYYNNVYLPEERKKDENKDLLDVELLFSDTTKAEHSEVKLANQLLSQLKNNSHPGLIYNLVLGNQAAAFNAHQYDSLLDISDTVIKPDLFNPRILKAHNELAGQGLDPNKIYSIPFDVTDVDALVFNLDIMYEILTLIKNNGGTVDENSNIYKKSMEAITKGTALSEKSLFKKLKAKSNTVYNGLTVNDNTFKGILTTLEFSKKFYDGLDIDFTGTEGDATIFTIDYQQDAFFKALKNETGKDLVTVQEYKEKNPKLVNYNFEKDTDFQNKFKDLFSKFSAKSEIKQTVNKTTLNQKDENGNAKESQVFFNVRYAANGATDWASWDIRNFKTAIAYAPLVGVNQTVQSPVSKSFFATSKNENGEIVINENLFKTFATNDDVYYEGQVIKNRASDQIETYQKGGSNLIAIKTGDERYDKSTKHFLNFLFKGQIQDSELSSNLMINVADYIAESSSYIVPSNEFLKQEKVTEYENKIKMYEEKIKESNTKKEDKEQYELRINNLRAAIITLKGALNYQNTEKIGLYNTYSLDSKSSEVVKSIQDWLLDSTKKNANIKEVTSEKALEHILGLVKIK